MTSALTRHTRNIYHPAKVITSSYLKPTASTTNKSSAPSTSKSIYISKPSSKPLPSNRGTPTSGATSHSTNNSTAAKPIIRRSGGTDKLPSSKPKETFKGDGKDYKTTVNLRSAPTTGSSVPSTSKSSLKSEGLGEHIAQKIDVSLSSSGKSSASGASLNQVELLLCLVQMYRQNSMLIYFTTNC